MRCFQQLTKQFGLLLNISFVRAEVPETHQHLTNSSVTSHPGDVVLNSLEQSSYSVIRNWLRRSQQVLEFVELELAILEPWILRVFQKCVCDFCSVGQIEVTFRHLSKQVDVQDVDRTHQSFLLC